MGQGDGGQLTRGRAEEDAEESCSCSERPLNDSSGESEGNLVQVPIPCADGGVHARSMLDRAEHFARGHADPRLRLAFYLAWPGGNRPPHPAALTSGVPISGRGKRPAAVRSALQFTALFQWGVPELDLAIYVATGVYSALKLMVYVQGTCS